MKQKPLLISLLISLGTGVIAGFLLLKVWNNTRMSRLIIVKIKIQ